MFYRLFIILMTSILWASNQEAHLSPVKIDRHDIAAQQRGAQMFFNYCSGCHSLKYARYNDLARDLKILNEKNEIDKELIETYLNFNNDDYRAPILTSLDPKDADIWFGKAPPDLSLEIRSRGINWVYSFLRGFYRDDSRPLGVNNIIYPNVGMPHILVSLQGLQDPIYNEEGHVIGVKPATGMTEQQVQKFDNQIKDLVSFLDYVSEPHKNERLKIGKFALLFLTVFSLFCFLYYKEVWKDIK
jgi:ubiquinol-cytochrome c reductase cytochrome c1 subunit